MLAVQDPFGQLDSSVNRKSYSFSIAFLPEKMKMLILIIMTNKIICIYSFTMFALTSPELRQSKQNFTIQVKKM